MNQDQAIRYSSMQARHVAGRDLGWAATDGVWVDHAFWLSINSTLSWMHAHTSHLADTMA